MKNDEFSRGVALIGWYEGSDPVLDVEQEFNLFGVGTFPFGGMDNSIELLTNRQGL